VNKDLNLISLVLAAKKRQPGMHNLMIRRD